MTGKIANDYDVFLSFKNLDEDGRQTRDSILAEELFRFLVSKQLNVFYSNLSLENLGVSAYKQAIDDALDQARILIAIGTSAENLQSPWVRYEWDSFFSDILSGVKRDGRVFVYLEKTMVNDLPRALRQSQVFQCEEGSNERIYRFISAALGRKQPSSIRERIAIGLHEQFRSSSSTRIPFYTEVKPWEDLQEFLKEATLTQADHVIESVKSLGYTIVESKRSARIWRQTENEIERLAELEHERWVQERMDNGWSYGPQRDDGNKIHDCLVPWDRFPESMKEYDRAVARSIPNILASNGLEIIPSTVVR